MFLQSPFFLIKFFKGSSFKFGFIFYVSQSEKNDIIAMNIE